MKIKAVAYDFDGVIVDSLSCHYLAIQAILSASAIKTPPLERIYEWWYSPYEQRLAEMGVTMPVEESRQIYNATMQGKVFPVFPGVASTIIEISKKRIPLFIITAGHTDEPIKETLAALGILQHFNSIYFGKEDKRATMLQIAENLALKPSEILFIGDTKQDMLCSRSAGLLSVGFDCGYGGTELLGEGGAHIIISDHEELLTLID